MLDLYSCSTGQVELSREPTLTPTVSTNLRRSHGAPHARFRSARGILRSALLFAGAACGTLSPGTGRRSLLLGTTLQLVGTRRELWRTCHGPVGHRAQALV